MDSVYYFDFICMAKMCENSVLYIGKFLVYAYLIADLNEYVDKYVIPYKNKTSNIYKLCKKEDANLVFTSVK